MLNRLSKCLFTTCSLAAAILPHVSTAQSYLKLHEKAIVVDTHNDVLTTATLEGMSIETDLTGKTHSDLARFKKGGVDVQVFSIFSAMFSISASAAPSA